MPILDEARARGANMLAGVHIPKNLDHFSIYAGLLRSALDLGKLVATEKRDIAAISAHYNTRMADIQAAFSQIEGAMIQDFHRDESLRERTFESINLLIEKGQYEVAADFHRRMIEGFSRPALETILQARNEIGSATGVRMRRIVT